MCLVSLGILFFGNGLLDSRVPELKDPFPVSFIFLHSEYCLLKYPCFLCRY